VDDAEVSDANPEFNFGGNVFLKIGYCCGEFPGESRTYLKFDISSIPAGSKITGGSLRLYLDSGTEFPGGHIMRAYSFTGNQYNTWSEFDITWNNRPDAYEFLDQVVIGTTPQDYYWQVSANVIQDWLDGAALNNGIVIVGEWTEDRYRRTF